MCSGENEWDGQMRWRWHVHTFLGELVKGVAPTLGEESKNGVFGVPDVFGDTPARDEELTLPCTRDSDCISRLVTWNAKNENSL